MPSRDGRFRTHPGPHEFFTFHQSPDSCTSIVQRWVAASYFHLSHP
jgi:pyrroloquinoline quinone (PQQ) biosynthesis protein C